jgi:hypothetical protein
MIENLAAISAVVLAIGERECGTTTETNIGIDPFWSCLRIYHGRIGDCKVSGREFKT